jgi:nicotinate phosphoribosyltransferase
MLRLDPGSHKSYVILGRARRGTYPVELSTLRLKPEERAKLSQACPYFSDRYLDYLESIKLDPKEQVKLEFTPKGNEGMGEIGCSIQGVWRDTILYEVPILAICELFCLVLTFSINIAVSEAYFNFVDTDWEMDRVQGK